MKSYRFIDGECEVKTEIKRSVFIATIKGEVNQDEADEFVKSIKKKYPDATHNCYAYIGDELGNVTRFSDDGEPSGTAGQPILDVLRKQNIVKSAIVVTRYFGGIKLGAGGLVGAYSGSASEAVNCGKISVKVECEKILVGGDYATYAMADKFLRKSKCIVQDVVYDNDVRCTVFVPLDDVDSFVCGLTEATLGRANVTKTGEMEYKREL